jgi:ribose-phosphate pyrophosphokinase
VKSGESLAAAWAGMLLKASGIDQILTVDVHSERDRQLFPIPLISLSSANLFAAEIEKRALTAVPIVAPDRGAIARCQAVKKELGSPPSDLPYFEKKRTEQGIVHRGLVGEVGRRAIIVDDMLDTGGTLVSACEKLIEAKVEEICIFVTHGLFTGEEWRKLWSLRVSRIFCTDTVPPARHIKSEDKITILPVASMLQGHLAGLEVKASS